TLKTLDLGTNGISDRGAQYLVDALQINMTLTTFDFTCNKISYQMVQYLTKILEKNSSYK
ncbi:unnamed protein product, partial [Adineta steineri]